MFSSTQLQALSDLYYATNGSYWSYGMCQLGNPEKVAWNFTGVDINPCLEKWCGLTCTDDQTSIRGISLNLYELQGKIPQSVDWFVDLEILDLSSNELSGRIPLSLIKLSKLKSLILFNNKLTGSIPSIFWNESALVEVSFTANQLEGTVPISFKELPKITKISFSDNKLWGELLDWLTPFQLSTIEWLDISTNLFSGFFPSVSNLTKLHSLDVSNNNLQGSFPDIIYHSNKLQLFSISQNHFTGTLPLFPLAIDDVAVTYNQLTGRIDQIDWTRTSLIQLTGTSNYFTGNFPQSLCLLTSLFTLDLGFNYLTGPLAMKTCQEYLYPNLYQLTLQGNFFTGPLHEIFNTSQNHMVYALALSNNDLTGSISGEFFRSASSLEFYSIGSNCLSGTLPDGICTLNDLEGFSMDGASTSEICRRQIVDLPSLGLSAFVSVKQIKGTIPSCLFELPRLMSLYLSGNGLTGTLPSSISFTDSINPKNMSLSYNQLTGTVPMSWYNHTWELLDLSYNKLIGSLPEGAEEFNNLQTNSSTITLEVNRLSGIIPSDVTSFTGSISLLKGNMLSCNFFKEELPKNDPDYDTYVCGSNMVDSSIYLWLIVGISLWFFAIGIAGIRKMQSRVSDGKRVDFFRWFGEVVYRVCKSLLIENSCDLPEAMLKSSSRYPSTFNFFSFTLHIRQYAVLVLCFMVVVLLPAYGILGVYYRTYEERYAWSISAAFLSGTEATIPLMVLFVVLVVLSVYLVHRLFRKAVKEYYNRHVYCVNGWWLCENWRVMGLWTIAWLINGTIMITADSLYVSLIINRSTKYDYLIQMTLAMFKLVWHDMGIFQMIHQLKRIFIETAINKAPNSFEDNSNDDNLTHPMLNLSHNDEYLSRSSLYSDSSVLTTQDIRYLTYMSIINKVIIPCLAIFFISSSCFYNALVSETPPTAYSFMCYGDGSDCVNLLGSGSSFTPAFTYSYQCSSAFLTDYVPVFVFMLLVSSVLVPAVTMIMVMLYERFKEQQSTSRWDKLVFYVVKRFLPFGWGGVAREEDQIEFRRRAKTKILHRKQLLTLRISYTFAVMFVFGSLFPPLALIATIAIMNITMLEEYLTKTMLRQCCELRSDDEDGDGDVSSTDYLDEVERECKDIEWNWFKVMKLIMYLTCGLCGFVLFDVCGDFNGWREGLIPMVLMILFPFVLYPMIAWRKKKNNSIKSDYWRRVNAM